jgi:hypothetical protein
LPFASHVVFAEPEAPLGEWLRKDRNYLSRERDRERQRAKESAEREGREDCTAIVDELLVLEEHNICANLIQKGSSKR